jgi:hypothetical protein
MNLRVICSQTIVRQCPCQTLQCQPLQFQGGQCLDKNQKTAVGLWLTKCPMGHIPLVKRLQGSCEDIYFLHALSPFLNHTFYTESLSLSPSLPLSRAVKKMTIVSSIYRCQLHCSM